MKDKERKASVKPEVIKTETKAAFDAKEKGHDLHGKVETVLQAREGSNEKPVSLLKQIRYLLILPYMALHFGAMLSIVIYHPSWAKANGVDLENVSNVP